MPQLSPSVPSSLLSSSSCTCAATDLFSVPLLPLVPPFKPPPAPTSLFRSQAASGSRDNSSPDGGAGPLPGRGRPAAAGRPSDGGEVPAARRGDVTGGGAANPSQHCSRQPPQLGPRPGRPGTDVTGGGSGGGAAPAGAGSGPAVPSVAEREPEARGVAARRLRPARGGSGSVALVAGSRQKLLFRTSVRRKWWWSTSAAGLWELGRIRTTRGLQSLGGGPRCCRPPSHLVQPLDLGPASKESWGWLPCFERLPRVKPRAGFRGLQASSLL